MQRIPVRVSAAAVHPHRAPSRAGRWPSTAAGGASFSPFRINARAPCRQLPSPPAGTDSERPAKDTGEMRLIGHSAVEGNLRNWHQRTQHDHLGATHAPSHDVDVRSLTEGPRECAREVVGAQLNDASEVGNPEVRIDVGLDVGGDAFRPPGSEAAAQIRKPISSVSVPARAALEQRYPFYGNFVSSAHRVSGTGQHPLRVRRGRLHTPMACFRAATASQLLIPSAAVGIHRSTSRHGASRQYGIPRPSLALA